MAKKPTIEETREELRDYFKVHERRPKATIMAAVLLVMFFVVIFFVMPGELPRGMQRLVGVVNALLAALVVAFAFNEYGKSYQAIRLPLLNKLNMGTLTGGLLFCVVMGWWLTPLAPIRVSMPSADDLSKLLRREVTLAVLVMPDTTLAVLEAPVPSWQAVEMASRITGNADVYSRLLKSIAEQRFVEAPALVERAKGENIDPGKLAIAQGQMELFAGRYAEAIPHFDQAVKLAGRAEVTSQQAIANALAGNLAKAFEIASKSLDDARAASGEGENLVGVCLNLKAAIALSGGRFKDAMPLLEDAQKTWAEVEDSLYKAASRNNQGVAYAMMPKKYAGAETQLDGALALWGTESDSAHVATCRNNLGVLAISQAKFAKAEEQLGSALQIGRRQYSENSAGLFPLLNASARLQTIFGRYPTAEKLTDEAETGARRSLLLEATIHGTQGSLLVGQGKYADAAGQFSKALAVSKDAAVADHLYLADLRCRLASVNTLLGRDTDLATEFPIAIGEVSRQVGENHPLLGRIECTWGWSNLRTDKKADAKKHFEDAQKIFAANKAEIPESPETGHCLAGMARLFPKREWREAVKKLQEAGNVEIAVFGPALNPSDPKSVETPALAGYLADEALLYTINGVAADYETAAGLFERSIAMREKLLPPLHPELASSYERFAVLLKKMNKADEAAAMEKKAQAARDSTIKKN